MAKETSYTKERIETANKLVSLIRDNFTDCEIEYFLFSESMWLAMQMLCSPQGAAQAVKSSQVTPF